MDDEKIETMNEAATKAEEELGNLTIDQFLPVAKWWQKWYLKAGHKRLGRILIKKLKEVS